MYLIHKIIKVGETLGKVVSHLGDRGEVLTMDNETFDLNKINISLADVQVVEAAREMTVEEFYETLSNHYFYDDTIQELKFSRENNISDKLMEMTIREAINRSVFLKDLNDFEYDSFFYNVVKDFRL